MYSEVVESTDSINKASKVNESVNIKVFSNLKEQAKEYGNIVDKLREVTDENEKIAEAMKNKAIMTKELQKQLKLNQKYTNPTQIQKMSLAMSKLANTSGTFAKNMNKAVTAARAFVATGIGALIAMIGKVFNFASDVLNQYKGATSHNIAAAKMGVDGNQLLAIQQVMKHNGLENEDLIGSMTKAFDSVRDWNKASNFAALGLSQESIAKMDGVEANRFMMDSMIAQVKKMGGFDNKDAKALLKDHIESIGFSWDTLMAMDKLGLDKSIWQGNGVDNVTYASASAKIKESGRDMQAFSKAERKQGVVELNTDFNKTMEQARQAAAKAGEQLMDMFNKLLKAIEPLGDYINKFSTTISDFINGIKEAFGSAGIMGLAQTLKLAFVNAGTEIKYFFLGMVDDIRLKLPDWLGGISKADYANNKVAREKQKEQDIAQNILAHESSMEELKRKHEANQLSKAEERRQLDTMIQQARQKTEIEGRAKIDLTVNGNPTAQALVMMK